MSTSLGESHPRAGEVSPADLRFLRVMLGLQVALGLLWGISMLFFARVIILGEASGQHIEKIAMEGAAHLMLVFGAILVWKHPYRSRDVLLLMIFLNALWTVTDLVYIPMLGLSDVDFYAKVVVNAILAIGLALAGRRTSIL